MSLNKVMLIGNLGQDPEQQTAQSGSKIVNFSLATTDKWKDRDGNPQERTEWHRIAVFNEKLGELAMRFLKRGSRVYVEGEMQYRKYTDKNGLEMKSASVALKAYSGEIRFLSEPRGQQPTAGTTFEGTPDGTVTKTDPDGKTETLDVIPF